MCIVIVRRGRDFVKYKFLIGNFVELRNLRVNIIMHKIKKFVVGILSFVMAGSFAFGPFSVQGASSVNGQKVNSQATFSKVNGLLQNDIEKYFDDNVIYKLPDTIADNQDISVIVTMDVKSVMDAYDETNKSLELSEFVTTREAKTVSANVVEERNALLKLLYKAGIDFELGDVYDTLFGGFEITVNSSDFDKVQSLLSYKADLIIGEEYAPCETEVVTNLVDVYETGIFDSSSSEYQGDGVVVAVLDTGLDYTHTAFSVDNFTTDKEAFTLESVSAIVGDTVASSFTSGLTGEDVYISKKVPYAYDYADKDPDVLPIDSSHGTHVAGVIAGKDDTITGVAPNAQLAIMKVFSDTTSGAKTSWLLAALEDCAILGVDVINMSLGSQCGFSREVDEEKVNEIYDRIRETGISLIVSAGNAYNATFGSDKNGSNGLTSNPDSGTVGSPSTYAASLSVASVDGVKTPYLLYNDDVIYFNEASTNSASVEKHFVDDVLATLGDDVQSYDFEYATIPGVGRSADYPEDDYTGRIVLVKRGQTNFEDKVRIALKEKNAAGIIIYNNVSGTISMSVGANIGAVCSISQEEGEKLAAHESGIIRISKDQVAGPFMSDFSSWGPTSDLKIKPEITAHGGQILSAVPGQHYERMSGTSMAAPNQAGATALIRQYVKYSGVFGNDLSATEVTALVNRLMMSTADIIMNKNGLPYAVRKQGSGLVNITKASTSAGYITTFDKDGAMDKTKIELGDDKNKSGVYEMTFDVTNISKTQVTYDIDAVVMTEGVSSIYTSHSDRTVTQDGYLLSGATTVVTEVIGAVKQDNKITVDAGKTAKVSVKITLSDEDKKYLDESFENGMYVEGFVKLNAVSGTSVGMNVPYLAFYGDWTAAPIFDEEYYDTNKDEINAGLDDEDKLMADAYATRVIGGLYSDYIATLGVYYFAQDPNATQIAANKDYIAISNVETDNNWAISSIRSISAGLLRNAKEVNISVVDDSTGKEIFNRTEYNQRKSSSSGNTVYASSIDVEFSALENKLKNNTRYMVTVSAYIDYDEKSDQKNLRNTFTFPLYVDFEAPIITDVAYRTEYDKVNNKTKLYADLSIYDNHYASAVQLGQITHAAEDSGYLFNMESFGKYVTPVYSAFNSTSTVTIELTDYVSQIKNSIGIQYNEDGSYSLKENTNSFIATCYDYAMNSATYEIRLPDEIIAMYFTKDMLSLNPNETLDIASVMEIYPGESWLQVLDFETSDSEIVDVVNQTIIAKTSGTATITAIGYDADGNKITASVEVKVLAEGDEGYFGSYTRPEVKNFTISNYSVNKAYYSVSSSDRDIGVTGGKYDFANNYTLSMYPSESVTLGCTIDSYFPDKTTVQFKSSNTKVATVTENGTIIAQAKGTTIIFATVVLDGKETIYTGRVTVTVKDPFNISSIYLISYKGLGGTVEIPSDRGITTINAYAFSNYEYVDKDLEAGDVIDDEDPYLIKQSYLGEDTITKIIIPDGVTTIEDYAFAGLTALEEVVLPSTLTKIGLGAFYGCEKLTKINLENVQFINENAFANCGLQEVNLDSVVAIGNYSFRNCKLNYINLPVTAQSLGIGAFYNNEYLTDVKFRASKIKLGSYAFANCSQISKIEINAAVISSYAFLDCSELSDVTLGKDVSVIGEFAFKGTNVSSFKLNKANKVLSLKENGALIYKGEELLLVAPCYSGRANKLVIEGDSIATGAFAGNKAIFSVEANNVKYVAPYAFASCTNLREVTLNSVTEIGDYAFAYTALTSTPNFENVYKIGKYAFIGTSVSNVNIPNGCEVGDYAFALCTNLEKVVIGNGCVIGTGAFYCPINLGTYDAISSFQYYTAYVYELKNEVGDVIETYSYYKYDYSVGVTSSLKSVTIGENSEIGLAAFSGNAKLTELVIGKNAIIGAQAFYNNMSLENVDLSGVKSIGAYAFSGDRTQDYMLSNNTWMYAYNKKMVGDSIIITDYAYTSCAPKFQYADVSSVEELGVGAFASNMYLKSVVLSNNLSAVPNNAFANCVSLCSVVLPENITELGNYAFINTAISKIDLGSVDTIGDYAFAITNIKSVTVKDGVSIGDSAFYACLWLEEIVNDENVSYIGANAFVSTAIKEINLENVTYIGDYAFEESALVSVVLGDKLIALGENPFVGCEIVTFGKYNEIIFGDKEIGVSIEENYDIGDNIKVIDGALYQVVPNGLELISYPIAKNALKYVVADDTVRVGARAFEKASLSVVELPLSLKTLGSKAFYGCENLQIVVFKSYEAPILEEEFDTSYLTYANLPIPGYFVNQNSVFEGLGISDYYMWQVTSRFNNFYMGANFVDYIGHMSEKIVMVKPANGLNYDTFIFAQYFGTTIEGDNAMTDDTKKVVDLINAIPNEIGLSDEDAIVTARAAYDKIISVEQQALVDNYSKLTDAEMQLAYLKSRFELSEPDIPSTPDKTENSVNITVWVVVIGVICLVNIVAVVIGVMLKKKRNR